MPTPGLRAEGSDVKHFNDWRVMREHPSGRPIRERNIKRTFRDGPRTHSVVVRLDGPPSNELAGGCGFFLPRDYASLSEDRSLRSKGRR